MALWGRKSKEERMVRAVFDEAERRSMENPAVPLTDSTALGMFQPTAAGVNVTTETALGVPAVWAAVNFISGTLAGLPLHLYKKSEDGRERVNGGLQTLLHDAPNEEWSSFAWRKYTFDAVLTEGRGYSFIERNSMGRVIGIWPLETSKMTVEKVNGRKRYRYVDGSRTVIYGAAEIIDVPFMLAPDQLGHRSPIKSLKNAIGLALALEEYGSRFFQNGGVPPLSLQGPFNSPAGIKRAADDVWEAIRRAMRERRNVLTMPLGHELKPVGIEPAKGQMVEAQRFQIEQIARIYSLPPVFLQDLTHGTFSNTEQQDLHFMKHTLKRWIEHFEQELNLKLFGPRNSAQYVEMNVDGLLRGDFKARMEGYATGIQNAILTPNEARRAENRPDDPQGDVLLVQGATVPLGTQPTQPTQEAPADDEDTA